MYTLSKKENALYSKLVKQYEAEQYWKICSLDKFLLTKYESEKNIDKHAMLYNIYWYNQNNF